MSKDKPYRKAGTATHSGPEEIVAEFLSGALPFELAQDWNEVEAEILDVLRAEIQRLTKRIEELGKQADYFERLAVRSIPVVCINCGGVGIIPESPDGPRMSQEQSNAENGGDATEPEQQNEQDTGRSKTVDDYGATQESSDPLTPKAVQIIDSIVHAKIDESAVLRVVDEEPAEQPVDLEALAFDGYDYAIKSDSAALSVYGRSRGKCVPLADAQKAVEQGAQRGVNRGYEIAKERDEQHRLYVGEFKAREECVAQIAKLIPMVDALRQRVEQLEHENHCLLNTQKEAENRAVEAEVERSELQTILNLQQNKHKYYCAICSKEIPEDTILYYTCERCVDKLKSISKPSD